MLQADLPWQAQHLERAGPSDEVLLAVVCMWLDDVRAGMRRVGVYFRAPLTTLKSLRGSTLVACRA